MSQWKPEDGVALRQLLSKVPKERIHDIMLDLCPAKVDADMILKNDADGIARLAAMKAGWDEYEKRFFSLAEQRPVNSPEPGFQDMT